MSCNRSGAQGSQLELGKREKNVPRHITFFPLMRKARPREVMTAT